MHALLLRTTGHLHKLVAGSADFRWDNQQPRRGVTGAYASTGGLRPVGVRVRSPGIGAKLGGLPWHEEGEGGFSLTKLTDEASLGRITKPGPASGSGLPTGRCRPPMPSRWNRWRMRLVHWLGRHARGRPREGESPGRRCFAAWRRMNTATRFATCWARTSTPGRAAAGHGRRRRI